jgi:hypothetical protein
MTFMRGKYALQVHPRQLLRHALQALTSELVALCSGYLDLLRETLLRL